MGAPLTHHATNSSAENALNYSDKGLEANEIETRETNDSGNIYAPAGAKAGFGSKVKRHCAKYWWLHLIIFCVCFLLIALLLTYVGMPRIAQHGVDESFLQVTVLKFLDPTPTSVSLTQGAILHSPSIFTPILDSFSAASYLVTNGTFASIPMIFLQMPRIHALHPTSSALIVDQMVEINNLDQLTDYAIAVLSNENVTTALTGKTDLHLGKLPVVHIHYNTSTTYKGLNGLQGFNVTNVKVNLTAPAGAVNLQGTAFIPNPSLMTIAMGNVTLILSTAKEGVVGTSFINDMTIVPGDNNFPMTAITNQSLIAQSLDANGHVEMFITGNSSVYNGQHLTYYEKALASNKLSLDMNIAQILADS